MTYYKVLGIDQSFNSFGYALIEKSDNGFKLIKKGNFTKLPRDNILKIYEGTDEILQRLFNEFNDIDLVAVELPAFSPKSSSIVDLVSLYTCIVLLLGYKYLVPILSVPATTLKKFTTGKGNIKKDMMLLEVYKKWGISCVTSDEADAIALANFGAEFLTNDVFSERFKNFYIEVKKSGGTKN